MGAAASRPEGEIFRIALIVSTEGANGSKSRK